MNARQRNIKRVILDVLPDAKVEFVPRGKHQAYRIEAPGLSVERTYGNVPRLHNIRKDVLQLAARRQGHEHVG